MSLIANKPPIAFKRISWKGAMTVLLNRLYESRNSSALFPKPPPSDLTPNIKGLTTRCEVSIFSLTVLERNSYIVSAPFVSIGVNSGAVSSPSLNVIKIRPALSAPVNFSITLRSICSLSCSVGTPFLKLNSIEGKNPLRILFKWKVETSRSNSM